MTDPLPEGATYSAYAWGPELAVILGVVEGLTEFLPVSSTGHLILVGHLFGFTGVLADSVEVAIQLGAILAVVAYERTKIRWLFSHAAQENSSLMARLQNSKQCGGLRAVVRQSAEIHPHLWFLFGLAVAFVPAAAVGFLGHDWIERCLFAPRTVALALIAGGVVIFLVEAWPRRPRLSRLEEVGVSTAAWVGMAQCAALFPGISRSGATIIGGLLAGMDRRLATEYSFFLALPTMFMATAYKMMKSYSVMTQSDWLALALGLIVSFVVAWVVIAAFMAYVKQHTLRVFAYYRIVLGILVLLIFP